VPSDAAPDRLSDLPGHRQQLFAARLDRWLPDLREALAEVYDAPEAGLLVHLPRERLLPGLAALGVSGRQAPGVAGPEPVLEQQDPALVVEHDAGHPMMNASCRSQSTRHCSQPPRRLKTAAAPAVIAPAGLLRRSPDMAATMPHRCAEECARSRRRRACDLPFTHTLRSSGREEAQLLE
jgi:hypothetical protein